MDAILAEALKQGLGYGIAVVLIFYILKKQETRDLKSEERETKYQQIIAELTNTVNVKLDKLIEKLEK